MAEPDRSSGFDGDGAPGLSLRLAGASPEQMAQALASLALPRGLQDAIAEDVRRSVTTGRSLTAEFHYGSDQGTSAAARYQVSPAQAERGGLLTVHVTVEDVPLPASQPERLFARREFMTRLLEAFGGYVYVKDVHGRYVEINDPLARLYGQARASIIGHTDAELFPREVAQRIWAADQRALESAGQVQLEESLPGAGSDRVFLSTKFPLYDQGLPYCVCSISTDVTEHRQAMVALGRGAQRIMKLNECFLSFGPDAEKNMYRLTSVARDVLGGACALYRRTRKGIISSCGLPDEPTQDLLDMVAEYCSALLEHSGEETAAIADLPEPHNAHGLSAIIELGLRTCVGHAVRLSGRTLGSLFVLYQENRVLDEEDKRLMGIIASALAGEERRQFAEERQAVVYGIARAATGSSDLSDLGRVIHRELERVLDAKNFYIALDDRERAQVVFPYCVDESLDADDHRVVREYDSGLTEWVIQHGKSAVLREDDIRAWAREGRIRIIGRVPRVWLGVPLIEAGETVGMMAVQDYYRTDAYDQDDLDLLEFVSGQVASVIRAKKAADALLESERRYRLLAENVSDVIWTCDQELRFTYVSSSVERMLGYEAQELVGRRLGEILTPDSASALQETLEATEGQPAECPGELLLELEHFARDGSRVWAEVRMTFLSQGAAANSILGVARDITERRALEQQFQQANKMESLGQLAGGIAHHFNNLLTVLNGYSQFIISETSENDPLRHDAEAILKAGKRAATLTKQLLDFSRRGEPSPEIINLNTLLSSTADLLRSVIGENIQLELRLAEDLANVRVDPTQITQVILNLAVNARDAMLGGGTLTLSTRMVPQIEPAWGKAARTQEYVELSVHDTGCGMPPEVQKHLFEPFFTTKEVGEGTGLGLATVYGIVTLAGGRISVDTAVGQGTTFYIFLPTVQEQEEPAQAPSPVMEGAPEGRELILILEDEDDVRDLAARMLRHLGYDVLTAPNGAMGLEQARTSNRPVDLVLADVVLPETSPLEFMRALKHYHPRARVLYMSGYSDLSLLGCEMATGQAPFLGKPFTMAALAQKVRQVLDAD